MSIKQTEKLEKEFKEYTESSPSEDRVVDLDSNTMVIFLNTVNEVLIFICYN